MRSNSRRTTENLHTTCIIGVSTDEKICHGFVLLRPRPQTSHAPCTTLVSTTPMSTIPPRLRSTGLLPPRTRFRPESRSPHSCYCMCTTSSCFLLGTIDAGRGGRAPANRAESSSLVSGVLVLSRLSREKSGADAPCPHITIYPEQGTRYQAQQILEDQFQAEYLAIFMVQARGRVDVRDLDTGREEAWRSNTTTIKSGFSIPWNFLLSCDITKGCLPVKIRMPTQRQTR